MEIIRAFNGLSFQKVVEADFPCVGHLSREYGQDIVENCIGVLISDLNTSFGGELDSESIAEICVEINSGVLKNHSLESVFLTCQKIKSSDVFGKLTVNKVLKEMSKSFSDLQEIHMQKNLNKHLSMKFTDPIDSRNSPIEQRKNMEARNWYINSKKD